MVDLDVLEEKRRRAAFIGLAGSGCKEQSTGKGRTQSPNSQNTQSLKYQEHIPARYDPHVQPGSKPAIQPLNELIKEGERPASKTSLFSPLDDPNEKYLATTA